MEHVPTGGGFGRCARPQWRTGEAGPVADSVVAMRCRDRRATPAHPSRPCHPCLCSSGGSQVFGFKSRTKTSRVAAEMRADARAPSRGTYGTIAIQC
eukprot:6015647-Prymnesium_polylepis.1